MAIAAEQSGIGSEFSGAEVTSKFADCQDTSGDDQVTVRIVRAGLDVVYDIRQQLTGRSWT